MKLTPKDIVFSFFTGFAAELRVRLEEAPQGGNADRSMQETCLDSNLSSLLLGSTHNVALFTVEGWHVLGCHAHPVTGRLEQLLCNLLSHLCLGPRRCIHLVQLQQGM